MGEGRGWRGKASSAIAGQDDGMSTVGFKGSVESFGEPYMLSTEKLENLDKKKRKILLILQTHT